MFDISKDQDPLQILLNYIVKVGVGILAESPQLFIWAYIESARLRYGSYQRGRPRMH
jgi:hypothetical protein